MALRSSPRLRALFQSDPSGKRAVFAPRLTRLASDNTVRKESTTKSSPVGRHGRPSSTKSKEGSVASKQSTGSSQVCRSRTRPSPRKATQTTPTKRRGLRSKNAKSSQTEGKLAKTACEPMRGRKNGKFSADSPTDGVGTVKRKRGRPPKGVKNCKRAKLASINESVDGTNSAPPTCKGGLVVSNNCHDVIDLTCDDETVAEEETDAAALVPVSFTSPELTHAHSAPDRLRTESSELRDKFDPVESNTIQDDHSEDSGEGTDVVEPSLHSDESLAIMFDLDKGVKNDFKVGEDHIPSLKRLKQISVLNPSSADSEREHVTSNLDLNSTESISDSQLEPPSSPTEEECPQPSTAQQKLVRRLARQKQLEEMRAREAALSREERLLRRRGILPNSARSGDSSAKKISWKDDQNLIEMFIYSPVKDEDDDTVSISSDDAVAMETSLAVT